MDSLSIIVSKFSWAVGVDLEHKGVNAGDGVARHQLPGGGQAL